MPVRHGTVACFTPQRRPFGIAGAAVSHHGEARFAMQDEAYGKLAEFQWIGNMSENWVKAVTQVYKTNAAFYP